MNDRRVLLAMWRQARVQLDWLAEDTPGRAYAHDPLWGLAALPARWRPQWAQHSFQTGDSDDDPMFGAVPSEKIARSRPSGVGVARGPDGLLCAGHLQPPGVLPGSPGALGR